MGEIYAADASWKGKARRRLVRLVHRRPARMTLQRPMVSFTFDDAPASAATLGAALLEEAGARGVYYISAALAGQDSPMGRIAGAQDVRRLAAAGHEIACHTFTHLDCGQADAEATRADVDENARTLAAWGAPPPVNFAYPYGDVSPAAKSALSGRFQTLRALHHGLIERGSDLNQAPGVGIEGPDGEAVAMRWLEAAAQRRAWVILYTHDVSETPSPWGCTPAALARLIDRAVTGGFDIVTVAEGARRIAA